MKYTYLFLLSLLSSTSSALENSSCIKAQPEAQEIFQELKYENGIACIYSEPSEGEHAKISFFDFKLNEYKEIASNRKLLLIDEMQSTVPPTLEIVSSHKFQITYSYPRDTYVIGIEQKNQNIIINEIYKSARLSASGPNDEALLITLSVTPSKINTLSFGSITQEEAFNAENLELLPGTSGSTAVISSNKSVLFNAPNDASKTKMYLIKGDTVELLEFKKNWLLIRYKIQKNKTIEKWIKFSDII